MRRRYARRLPTVASNNDFGIGLLGTSSGNLVEHNSITGNSNGILIQSRCVGQHHPPEHRWPEIRPARFPERTVPSDRLRHQGRGGRPTARATHSSGIGASPTQDRDLRPARIFRLSCRQRSRHSRPHQTSSGLQTAGWRGDDRRNGGRRQRPGPACQISGVTSNEPSGVQIRR